MARKRLGVVGVAAVLIVVLSACLFEGAWVPTPPMPAGDGPAAPIVTAQSVSCWAVDGCVAVSLRANGANRLDAHRWNGTDWTAIALPVPNGGEQPADASVSCSGDQECLIAVSLWRNDPGAPGFLTRVHRWSAGTVIADVYTDVHGREVEVSCAAPDACLVGSRDLATAWWDGTSWSTSYWVEAADLSCASSTSCVSVGGYQGAFTGSDLGPTLSSSAQEWDGTAWTAATTLPSEPGETVRALGVSCVGSAPVCTVVGGAAPSGQLLEPYAATRTGTGPWSIADLPDTGPGVLEAVSCSATTECLATGRSPLAPADATPLVLARVGSLWAAVDQPVVSEPGRVHLRDVSCRPTACLVLGDLQPAVGGGRRPTATQFRWQDATP